MTAPAPTVCPTCEGYGVVVRSLNADVQQLLPCFACRCSTCGQPCEYPPQCKDCAADEDAAAKRRADQ